MYKEMTPEREAKFRAGLESLRADVYPVNCKHGVFFIMSLEYANYLTTFRRPIAEVVDAYLDKHPDKAIVDCLTVMDSYCSRAARKEHEEGRDNTHMMGIAWTEIKNNPKRIAFKEKMMEKYPRDHFPEIYFCP